LSKSIAIEPGLLELLQKVAGVQFFLRHSEVMAFTARAVFEITIRAKIKVWMKHSEIYHSWSLQGILPHAIYV